MLTRCPKCSHAIWSEVRSFGTFRTAVYFDDEERSETYATAVWRCPGCGLGLRDRVLLDALRRVPPRR
jgi:DNA-directed RNA polymerase subunit RPC12/RpoP